MTRLSRRTYLAGLTGVFTAVAGCATDTESRTSSKTTRLSSRYENLTRTKIYVHHGTELSHPETISKADTPEAVSLIILPAEPDITTERAVEWLAAGKKLAIVGRDANEFVNRVERSGAARQYFEQRGHGDPNKPADLVVAVAMDSEYVESHVYSWNDGPSNQTIWKALDRAIGEIEERETATTGTR